MTNEALSLKQENQKFAKRHYSSHFGIRISLVIGHWSLVIPSEAGDLELS
jgi:hypothetical protein